MRIVSRWLALLALLLPIAGAGGAVIWVEGENPAESSASRHPWYSSVDRTQLSGGAVLSHWQNAEAVVRYNLVAPTAGEYQLWLRANPTATKLSFRQAPSAPWQAVTMDQAIDRQNIAADRKIDLRFIAWVNAGKIRLARGDNSLWFRLHSDNNNHGMIDCLVLANEPFRPRGILKPEEMAAAAAEEAKANAGWFAFDPPEDDFRNNAGLDLRHLNETFAGEGGFIATRGEQFIHSRTGRPVRFWAVNGAGKATNYDTAVPVARTLAKRGVNLVRLHGAIYDRDGKLNPAKVQSILGIVEAMKEQGIYTHLSIYFPLWMNPSPNNPALKGYDGKLHPFAALYFNDDFLNLYRSWWTALLTTPSPRTGKKLIDEPAVMGVEIINEDSFFFWTFNDKIPDPQLRLIEKEFGEWATKRHGSIARAQQAWNGLLLRRDNAGEGRLGFRNWHDVKTQRTPRDQDQVRFLAEKQKAFYDDQRDDLKKLGFKGVITASNWITASPELLGPIERWTYTGCDFIDRHGYFNSGLKGAEAAWSIRDGYTFVDRSALRFDGSASQRQFTHPVFDITYADKPTMISETTHERPSRYRGEAPLLYAAYGSMQDLDAIVHFALDSHLFETKPRFFMQQWSLNAPVMLGQFPAAAYVYRKGLIGSGEVLVDLKLKVDDLLHLKGTPLAEGVSLDGLRAKDVPAGEPTADTPIDPLVHLAGRTKASFVTGRPSMKVADLSKYIDRNAGVATSTSGELRWDWKTGRLTITAPQVQGASGNVGESIDLPIATITGLPELAHIVLVSLDGKPLDASGKILLQVMTEEKPTGFKTDRETGTRRIENIGRDPWLVREITGTVTLKRKDAAGLKLTPLDFNGYRKTARPVGGKIELDRDVVYYLIERN